MNKLWDLRFVLAGLSIFCGAVVALKWASQHFPSQLLIVGSIFLFAVLIRVVWVVVRNNAKGWRVRSISPEGWVYEERHNGAWVGITMAELMDYREPPHVLRIMSASRWTEYPEWTHGRRDEIVARIKAELKEPNYVLQEG